MKTLHFDVVVLFFAISVLSATVADGQLAIQPSTPVQLFPLSSVRLLPSPFAKAVGANREYLLNHDPDRLLAPLLREAGLQPKKDPYPNWESSGLDGHTSGHYLSALSQMIASGNDPDGELGRRLDYMLSEMARVQRANGDGYIGGISGSREFWGVIAAGNVDKIWDRWAPWYNVHKSFAGLRDAYVVGGRPKARELLIQLGDWCVHLTSQLDDVQMQQMLSNEYGGMNEVMADIYTITGDRKYLETAQRFNHHAVINPLVNGQDRLTGVHANTQIPKITGLMEIATLTGNPKAEFGARFFWDTVTKNRSTAFGGNSVSEHFNDPKDFSGMLDHREGPETCNTYNMLRLTEKLFSSKPEARYVDFYERALYNHILSTIDPVNPGYVYFTPIRPKHYRVYSQPEQSFWCCVGTGMENPGRYGQFIYAQDEEGIYVNLFIPSVVKVADGFSIEQVNKFPFEPRTRLVLQLDKPAKIALRFRHPWWIPEGKMDIRVNGQSVFSDSKSSTYAVVRRTWQNGDQIDVELPMHLTVDPLPDGSDWAAILYGPIVLAAPAGISDLVGARAIDTRMAQVAAGPVVPFDKVPVLLTTAAELPQHIVPDTSAGPLRFRIKDVVEPKTSDGIEIMPFFELRDVRYQMYWELTSAQELRKRREELSAQERAKAARDAATLDVVNPGEQQSEQEHDFAGLETKTGIAESRRWRDGERFQYTLNPHGEKAVDLAVTYWGGDTGRTFDILANDKFLATEELRLEKPGEFFERRYPIPAEVLSATPEGRVTIEFVAKTWVAGGVFDVRLIKAGGR